MGILLFIMGLIPFGIGYGLTFVPKMTEGYVAYVTAVLFAVIWFFIVKLGKLICKKTFKTVGNICIPALLDFLLVFIQIDFFEKFWDNIIGKWTVYFYDPIKPLGELIARLLPEQFYDIWVYLCSFGLMLIIALISSLTTRIKKKITDDIDKPIFTQPKAESKPSKNQGVYSGLEELAKKAEESLADLDKPKEEQTETAAEPKN